MKCPRDGTDMGTENLRGIEVELCQKCGGRWLDLDELGKLEATVTSTEDERRATIIYGDHASELKCPVCEKQMVTFDYRAHAVELDTCPDHGWWLDNGEEGRVRDIIAERVRDLDRSAGAEAGWHSFLGALNKKK
ncbi:MAG: zf-TFIIB domain-containing protein [Chloroflexota bacterium]